MPVAEMANSCGAILELVLILSITVFATALCGWIISVMKCRQCIIDFLGYCTLAVIVLSVYILNLDAIRFAVRSRVLPLVANVTACKTT